MSQSFFDGLSDITGGGKTARPDSTATTLEKGVQLHGKDIDGAFYIKAEDVVALLELNGVLPKATALLKRRIEK